jgi:ribosomal protein S24E
MSLTIDSNVENKVIGRHEIKGRIEFSGATPKKAEIAKMIGSKLGKEEKLVVIKKVKNNYGEQKADVEAYVYNNEETIKKVEPEKKVKVAPGAEAAKEGA